MLAVASSNYLCEIRKEESVHSQNDFPNVSIPFLHIVKEEMKERIAFVNEAITRGFYFHRNHLICLDNSLSNPKTYSTLKHLDFDLFESIIQKCWKNVVKYLTDPESLKHIDSVQRSRYLIVENMFLFQKDFSKELVLLRCVLWIFILYVLFYISILQMQMVCCRDGCIICYEFNKYGISWITRFKEFNETLPKRSQRCQLITKCFYFTYLKLGDFGS